jgi:hypothetical protein
VRQKGGANLQSGVMTMPRKLPFDAAAASLHQLVERMVPGEELVFTSKASRSQS